MLASKYRFHGYGALKYLFGNGRTYRFKSVSLRVATNPRRTASRAAVVISKKVIKASPKRNRVRRRVYEVLRTNWQYVKPGQDIVISVYDPAVLVMPHAELAFELTKALQQAGVWTEVANKTKTASEPNET